MAQHGYLGEGFGAHGDFDPERDDDRERGRFRDRERERDLREDQDFWRDQRPQFMFGDEDESERRRRRDTRGYGREHGFGGFQGDYTGREQGGFGGAGDYSRGRRSFSPHRDDHYLSWRDQQIRQLDRDYEEYCREREQDFHRDFDSWRQSRQSSRQQVVGGEKDELVLSANQQAGTTGEPQATVDPESAATLGEGGETRTGRGRR